MVLSSTGIVFVIIGLINAPAWGLYKSVYNAWHTELTPISPTLVLITMGFMLLFAFYIQQRRCEAAGKAGLMYMILGGVSFIVITYLQVAISLSSAHSGFIILLFSICMIAFSILTHILFKETPPKRLCLMAFIGLASASTSNRLSTS